MPYRLKITTYAGDEVRWAASPYSLETSTKERTTEVVQEVTGHEKSYPEKTAPPILDYSPQLETASRARLSGYGEAPIRATKFTREGSKNIQRAARAVDEVAASPGEILFFTGTLPGTGKKQFDAIARYSSYLVHRLKAWVARRVEAKYDFYCWELQKRGALHLHYAVYIPDEKARFEIRTEFKNEWIRLLDYVSRETGVDLYYNKERGFSHRENTQNVQADCQEVTKSLGAYLGKYLSKATNGTSRYGTFAPCRWYGISRPLRQYEKSLRRSITLTFGNVREWLGALDVWRNISSLCRETGWEWTNKVMPGFGGCDFGTKNETLDELLQLHFGERMKYASVNAKVRDKWRDLVRHIDYIEQVNPKWLHTMQRKHRSVGHWPDIKALSGTSLTDPSGLERVQHFTWALQDLLRDSWNTWKPRLKPGAKSRLVYLLREMENALLLHYEIDLKEFRNDDC